MSDREPFPYSEDWKRDFPVLIETGILQAISRHLTKTRPNTTKGVREGLHCRVVRSSWDFIDDGEPFVNIQFKFPSIIAFENDDGHYVLYEDPLNINDTETLDKLSNLADSRTTEVWNSYTGKFSPAEQLYL